MDKAGVKLSEVTVSMEKLLPILSKNFKFGEDYLIAVCPNGYGGFRPNTEGRSVSTATEVEKNGQLILGRPEDRDFFLNNPTRYEGAVPKPVFVCSDAHSILGVGQGNNRRFGVGEKYTWVKAKPTFEGLRQTLIEPKGRVQQSADFTEISFLKPKFKSIKLGGRIFDGQTIKFKPKTNPLNPNMVAIIGGRGTGKSLFLDSMHSLFHTSPLNNARNVNVESLSVTVDQGDGTEIIFDSLNDSYSYLHVSQGEIQRFSGKPSELSNEIKQMLGIHDTSFDSVTVNAISDNIGKYIAFVQYWEMTDPNGNRVHTPQFQQAIVEKNSKLLTTITSPQNKQLFEKYQENIRSVNERKALIIELRQAEASTQRALGEVHDSLDLINQKELVVNKVPSLISQPTLDAISLNIKSFEFQIAEHQTNNAQIIANFNAQGINQDISSLLDKITEYQSAKDEANAKIEEIQHRTNQYHQCVQNRASLVSTYRDYLQRQKTNIDEKFSTLKMKKEGWNDEQHKLVLSMLLDIKIKGSIIFDMDKFYAGLLNCLNGGKFRSTQNQPTSQRLEKMFAVADIDAFFELVSGNKMITCEGEMDDQGHPLKISIEELFWKSEYFNQGGRFNLINYLFSEDKIKNYLYVNADFEYKGKTVNKLSVGQRGTFYVCLKLATDPFGSPFVFDQPEDDLDNDFIMSQLVPLFNEIKKYRQVIIVTHNANLVVNTDAEQIIVASNEGEVISYEAGALEDGNVAKGEGIRASVCKILEGGSAAFEKRERKYGLQALI